MALLLLLKDLLFRRPWVLAIALLLLLCGFQTFRLRSAQLALARARTTNATSAAAIAEQNAAVSGWMEEALRQHARAEAAGKAAARIRVVTVTRIERVLAEPVPSDCPAAVSWGAEFGARLGQDWEEAAR
jgi:hypothetical protein